MNLAMTRLRRIAATAAASTVAATGFLLAAPATFVAVVVGCCFVGLVLGVADFMASQMAVEVDEDQVMEDAFAGMGELGRAVGSPRLVVVGAWVTAVLGFTLVVDHDGDGPGVVGSTLYSVYALALAILILVLLLPASWRRSSAFRIGLPVWLGIGIVSAVIAVAVDPGLPRIVSAVFLGAIFVAGFATVLVRAMGTGPRARLAIVLVIVSGAVDGAYGGAASPMDLELWWWIPVSALMQAGLLVTMVFVGRAAVGVVSRWRRRPRTRLTAAECEVCGRVPAQTVTLRRYVGLLLSYRSYRFEGPLCKAHAGERAGEWLGRTLAQGWWEPLTFYRNLNAVRVDVRALIQAARMAPPHGPIREGDAPGPLDG